MKPSSVVVLKERAERAKQFPGFVDGKAQCRGCGASMNSIYEWCDGCWAALTKGLE